MKMSDALLHAPTIIAFRRGAGDLARHCRAPASKRSWRDVIHLWMQRARQRQALADLTELGPHLLRDIGISYEEARLESEKPFWR
jgi:uncharacterized protein YjiS (DUF1127 family)